MSYQPHTRSRAARVATQTIRTLVTGAPTPREKAIIPDHPALEPLPEGMESERPGTLDKVVFGISAGVVIAFVLWGIAAPSSLKATADAGLSWVVTNMGWLFALSATGMVFFILWLAASKYGNIPLGRDGETPEFSTASWVAMMFSAGMGIGLMFYGAAEPLSHFVTAPPGTGDAGSTSVALSTTLFHWGLHPWAIYALVGVSIAYSVFRKGRPLTISGVFSSLLGRNTYGPAGKVIDVFAIFATLFGSATSLGIGALQIAEGARIVGWADNVGNVFYVLLITVLTICFILSAVSGVAKGIQYLSNINMVLAVVLALFVFVLGPTVFILNLLPTALGTYLQDLMAMAARTGATSSDASVWLGSWTIFYWAWWISWTPFVGMFIARISRGRTIRQFIAGVLLLPSAVSLVWFAIFGGAAIHAEQSGAGISEAGSSEATLFALLDTMPLSVITSVIVMILVAIFFVSGADAASIVMGTISENGTIEPRRWTVIFWGAATGAVAAVMLVVGGSDALNGLQSVTIMAALPFLFVMLAMAVALVRDLYTDPMIVRGRYARTAIEAAIVEGVSQHGDDFALAVAQTPPGAGVGAMIDEAHKTGEIPAAQEDPADE
ncbi:betaine/carnitine/choline transporter (BCCT) family transporter [Propionibacterium sp. oral taxon 192 str. F0372]|uniref:BCCT family transporter n=1 Tax=Propionibacterium sp. oral taxon 192 TaxID=671222 RepID=UPI000353147B|nr:BCCT family transporter [Propionibacterium sp. oral taxon 192]EPH06270.1 betaine/carnitine/choline transporter (BCCT) family transporter [Propionibacterium sp. oral taxon 192 str. F0372]